MENIQQTNNTMTEKQIENREQAAIAIATSRAEAYYRGPVLWELWEKTPAQLTIRAWPRNAEGPMADDYDFWTVSI
jgi:hypothetical protein